MKASKNLDPSIKGNIIRNLRDKFGYKITRYTDDQILDTYDNWSLSDDYPDESILLEWIVSECIEQDLHVDSRLGEE